MLIIILLILIIIRTIIILNPYNFNININFIKIIYNYKNYNYFYKNLKELVLYKSNFIIFFSPFKIAITIFSFNILLEDKAISRIN
ncbi:hypothetical protein C8034_v004372 [Colletotrichum sidae]|uniref:Uncharacterized protein n=1 Tax=Colletotrichum sidae TaxID=1347389 RepID=A0A4R8RWJ0_9PEZI|nr:hypothetical protein C8034_v004372 [Colletotrichum sidae]